MTNRNLWSTILANNTDGLYLGTPQPHTSWQAAAEHAERRLLGSLALELDTLPVLQQATEQALAQFAEAKPEQELNVTVSITYENATYDWCARITRLDATPAEFTGSVAAALLTVLLEEAVQAETALGAQDGNAVPVPLDETLDRQLARDLAAERLRQLTEALAGEPVLDALSFRRELARALETAAHHSDGDVERYGLRVAGGGDEGFTRLLFMPICDWNSGDEDTLGFCGRSFTVGREATLALHLRYLRWLATRI